METYLIIAAVALLCGIAIAIIRNPGILKKIIASSATGLMTLAVIDLTYAFTGIYIAVSVWTLAVAALLGLPGVISLLFLKIIWNI
ncbi:putative membrane protein [[Clostridium] cellulosi]|jgi:SigmaK-factor processing regulatory protein BofA.|uniref:Putative membrane protein n=1 Tax=[Clostridium] cellulosi TaxID=29343 RepID=A0A078KRU5_9FIRM|nr:putative membrane protein [[Clostridium] cellulosi]